MEIASGFHAIDSNFIKELILELSLHFGVKKVELQNSYFFQDSFPVVSYMIINPYSKYSKKIDDIVFLYHNSWGETIFDTFKSEIDITQIFLRVLNGGLITKLDFDSSLRIISSYPYHAGKDFKRIKLILRDIYSFFVEQESNRRKRYITVLGNKYFVFSSKKKGKDEIITSTLCNSELQMLYNVAYNRGLRINIRTDPTIPELNYLKTIIDNFKEDAVQIYFQLEKKYCYFFVSDERGSIMFFRKRADSFKEYLTKLYIFAENVAKHVTEQNSKSTLSNQSKMIEMYKLERDIQNNCKITAIEPMLLRVINSMKKKDRPFKVSIHLLDTGEIGYRFVLPDGGYSDIYNRTDMQKIGRELKVLMESVPGYSYYVTDIDLEHSGLEVYKDYTSFSFSEKIRFELLVESGLKI